MRQAFALTMLMLLLTACAEPLDCPSSETLQQHWREHGAQGKAFDSVESPSSCGLASGERRQAWSEGRQQYCGDAGNGWRQGALGKTAAVACEARSFQAAERMGQQWRAWLEERRELIAAIEQNDADSERRQMMLRRQRLERDLDMLRGIAATRGYPMQDVPDWREPQRMPQPESSP